MMLPVGCGYMFSLQRLLKNHHIHLSETAHRAIAKFGKAQDFDSCIRWFKSIWLCLGEIKKMIIQCVICFGLMILALDFACGKYLTNKVVKFIKKIKR